MTQFFRGDLAGLTIRPGKLTDKKVIDCLYTCKEGLDLPVPEDGGRGVKVMLASAHAASAEPGFCASDLWLLLSGLRSRNR